MANDQQQIIDDFNEAIITAPKELEDRLETDESNFVG